jgi:hypothetical protein
MRKLVLSAVVVFCAVFFVSAACADEMSFSLSGSGLSTSGMFYGSPTSPGTWLVTGATGTFNGVAITGVCPLGACTSYNYNNNYYWPAPVMDYAGIVLTLADGNWVNLCYGTGCWGGWSGYTAISGISSYTFLPADDVAFGQPTPEPGTLALLGSSVLGIAGMLRRRIF